jgi:hypothetical protein
VSDEEAYKGSDNHHFQSQNTEPPPIRLRIIGVFAKTQLVFSEKEKHKINELPYQVILHNQFPF